jgi:hypothetical protein
MRVGKKPFRRLSSCILLLRSPRIRGVQIGTGERHAVGHRDELVDLDQDRREFGLALNDYAPSGIPARFSLDAETMTATRTIAADAKEGVAAKELEYEMLISEKPKARPTLHNGNATPTTRSIAVRPFPARTERGGLDLHGATPRRPSRGLGSFKEIKAYNGKGRPHR